MLLLVAKIVISIVFNFLQGREESLRDFMSRKLEEAGGSGFAGERSAFDGTGADEGVRHVNRGGQG